MSELQNNPEPETFVIERAGEGLRDWRVSRLDGGDKSELGVYETYTEAVAAINVERDVDPDDIKAEVMHPRALSDDGHGYGAYQANPNDPNYDALQSDDDWDDHSDTPENTDR